jgi:murein L,D-transpeptidase YafK
MTLRGCHSAVGCAAALIVSSLLITTACKADGGHVYRILVKKADRKMYLFSGNTLIRAYHIALGANPKGDKHRRGDKRTPEGTYTIDFKNPNSAFYKSIHISYPNLNDIQKARRDGVDPGGEITIHGQKNGYRILASETQKFDWTDGCIAVTDKAMDEIWSLVSVGTTIEIQP